MNLFLTVQHDSFSDCFKHIPDLRMTLDIGHGELLSQEKKPRKSPRYKINKGVSNAKY